MMSNLQESCAKELFTFINSLPITKLKSWLRIVCKFVFVQKHVPSTNIHFRPVPSAFVTPLKSTEEDLKQL
jgi:hypothetical protein